MKKTAARIFTFILFSFYFMILTSCVITFESRDYKNTYNKKSGNSNEYTIKDCPSEIAKLAFEYAKEYAAADTEYVYGGQDPLRAIRIDCSGLVIMCYTYALQGTDYKLIEPDMSSVYMYENAATITTTPRQGDLIFMGDDSNDPSIYHIAVFDRFEGDQVYFIDSTSQGQINGVSERHYARTNKKIKAYGIMKLKS